MVDKLGKPAAPFVEICKLGASAQQADAPTPGGLSLRVIISFNCKPAEVACSARICTASRRNSNRLALESLQCGSAGPRGVSQQRSGPRPTEGGSSFTQWASRLARSTPARLFLPRNPVVSESVLLARRVMPIQLKKTESISLTFCRGLVGKAPSILLFCARSRPAGLGFTLGFFAKSGHK